MTKAIRQFSKPIFSSNQANRSHQNHVNIQAFALYRYCAGRPQRFDPRRSKCSRLFGMTDTECWKQFGPGDIANKHHRGAEFVCFPFSNLVNPGQSPVGPQIVPECVSTMTSLHDGCEPYSSASSSPLKISQPSYPNLSRINLMYSGSNDSSRLPPSSRVSSSRQDMRTALWFQAYFQNSSV